MKPWMVAATIVALTVICIAGVSAVVPVPHFFMNITTATPTPTPTPTSTPTTIPTTAPPGDTYGAESFNTTGLIIGGGAGYVNNITTGDYVVTSKETLKSALGIATPGQVIYVAPGTTIDLTGENPIGIPAGVTLASNRGVGGSSGATIKKSEYKSGFTGNSSTSRYTSTTWEQPMLFVMGDDVRITGLQIEGEMFPQDYEGISEQYFLVGIFSRSHDNLIVDNNELRGWSWSAVQTAWTTGTIVKNNYIHSNQARGEGYGGSQYGGEVLYERNLYNYNRHSITSSGLEDETYTARYNIVIGDGDAIGASHFDVHENEDELDNTAGDVFYIHHNTFMDGDDDMTSVHIRTRPTTGAYIYNNWFQAVSTEIPGGYPIYQTFRSGDGYSSLANMYCTNNKWVSTVYSTNTGIAWFQLI